MILAIMVMIITIFRGRFYIFAFMIVMIIVRFMNIANPAKKNNTYIYMFQLFSSISIFLNGYTIMTSNDTNLGPKLDLLGDLACYP